MASDKNFQNQAPSTNSELFMQTVKFSNTGIDVSRLCLGTMMFGDRCDENESTRILDTAIAQGVSFIDTAASYCGGVTEEILGRNLGARRKDIFLCTKVTRNTSSDWIVSSLNESLTRLQTDYIDLFLIHWPRENMDTTVMMETLNTLAVEGKVRYIGCCNFPAWLIAHCNSVAMKNGWEKLINNQVPYNLIERGIEVEILPQALVENIAITTYRPVSQGVLAGKYRPGQSIPADSRGQTDERITNWLSKFGDSIIHFDEYARDHGLHPAQLAVAWNTFSKAITSAIVGVSSERQLQASIDAAETTLTSEQYAEITDLFDTSVKEEFAGNFVPLRRATNLVRPAD